MRQSTDLLDLKSGDAGEGANPSRSAALGRRWAASLPVALCALVGPGPGDASAQEPIPELVPPGWTMRTSTNSLYFTRTDIPNIQVALVNDLRTELSQDQKFEAVKEFFAERAGCPALASAETEKSFGAYTAFDDAQAPRCFLTAMGHWREGGLQVSLILNETPDAGPKPGDGVFEAILEDILQYSMFRYEVGDKEVEVNLPPEAYAKRVDPDHKPVRILSFVDESAPFLRAITAIEIMNLEPGEPLPRRDRSFQPLLLFAGSGTGSEQLGSLCSDWDPGFFSPAAILTYHATNKCFRFDWRWTDGVEGGDLEVKAVGGDWTAVTDYLRTERGVGVTQEEPYRKIRRGATFDLRVGLDPTVLGHVSTGEVPITELGPNDAILTSDGKITLGHLESATLPELDPTVATYRPVSGTYFFDGHVITIKLANGHVVRGFAGWLPGDGESELGEDSTLMINGVHYFSRWLLH